MWKKNVILSFMYGDRIPGKKFLIVDLKFSFFSSVIVMDIVITSPRKPS